MKTLRTRPKGPFVYAADWKELYVLTEHWISDLEFYRDELTFMRHLLRDYFMWLFRDDGLEPGREMGASIRALDQRCKALLAESRKLRTRLADLLEDPYRYDSHEIRKDYDRLEEEITGFVSDFRDTKGRLFTLTKHLMSSEEFLEQLNT